MCSTTTGGGTPCKGSGRHASFKHEYTARMIRLRIHKVNNEFLEDFPSLHPVQPPSSFTLVDWDGLKGALSVDERLGSVGFASGMEAANNAMANFLHNRLHCTLTSSAKRPKHIQPCGNQRRNNYSNQATCECTRTQYWSDLVPRKNRTR